MFHAFQFSAETSKTINIFYDIQCYRRKYFVIMTCLTLWREIHNFQIMTWRDRYHLVSIFRLPVVTNADPALRWRHNERDGVSNHQPYDRLLNRLFRRRSKKKSKLRVAGLCAGMSSVTHVFPAQMASKAENVPIWWRHHDMLLHT